MKKNSITDEAGNVIVEKTKEKKEKKDTVYIVFYVLSVVLLVYLAYAAYTSYQSFVDYCANYNLNTSDQLGMLFQTVFASVVPCIAYAATMYGIGYLIKTKK